MTFKTFQSIPLQIMPPFLQTDDPKLQSQFSSLPQMTRYIANYISYPVFHQNIFSAPFFFLVALT